MRDLFLLLFASNYLFSAANAQVLQNGTTCRMITFIPFSDRRDPPPRDSSLPPPNNSSSPEEKKQYGYGTWPDPASQAKYAFSLMAAAELARHHFNARDPSLVPELGQLGQCNITMPDPEPHEVLYIDTGYDKISTSREFNERRFIISQIFHGGKINNGGGNISSSEFVNGRVVSNDTKLPISDKDFCAFIGPVHPYVVDGVTFFAESGRIPMITYETTSTKFSSQRQFPLYVSTIPNAMDYGEIVAKSFRDIWTREGVGIIFDKDDYTDFGVEAESPLRDNIEKYGYEATFAPMYQFDDESIRAALEDVKKKGYRTVILLNDRPGSIEKIAQMAYSMGMIGSGYFWLLMGDAFRPSKLKSLRYTIGSPMDNLLSGAALFTNYDRHIYDANSPFLQVWRSQTILSIEKLNRLQPLSKDRNEPFYTAKDSYFQDERPAEYASYIYDAVMLAGISACKDYSITFGNTSFSHITEMRNTEFTGASGKVRFSPKQYVVEYDGISKSMNELLSTFKNESTRDPQDVIFGIYNIRRGEVDANEMRSYLAVLTHLYSYETKHVANEPKSDPGVWVAVTDTEFLYFDGTVNEPMPRRDVYDANYIAQGIQVVGLVLSIVAFMIVIATACLLYAYQKEKLIKAGQPEFLYLLCFGAALVALSSIFVLFDESDGLSTDQLSGMCSAFPWLFVVGYLLMYCALISKLWRLSKLMQMRRKVVHAKQVLFPIIIIMASSFLILTLMQILDPVQWLREGTSDIGEPYETYGECTSLKYGKFPFILPIAILIFISVTATAVFSYKLRNVQSDLAESSWIFSGIFIHIQTWLVGLPVLYITNGISRDAYILMIVILAFTFATSLVGVVIFPKLYNIFQQKYFGGMKTKTSISIDGGVSRVTGLSGTASNSLSLSKISDNNLGHDSSSKKLSVTETETLKLKIIELTLEAEALNIQVAELEECVSRNDELIQKVARSEARVAELEGLLNISSGRPEQAQICI